MFCLVEIFLLKILTLPKLFFSRDPAIKPERDIKIYLPREFQNSFQENIFNSSASSKTGCQKTNHAYFHTLPFKGTQRQQFVLGEKHKTQLPILIKLP